MPTDMTKLEFYAVTLLAGMLTSPALMGENNEFARAGAVNAAVRLAKHLEFAIKIENEGGFDAYMARVRPEDRDSGRTIMTGSGEANEA
ncbi:hypothetical protein J5277_16415 [Rhizobium sp. 16-449-1b]|uniref:hypothetical protein n=1 Tax=Rhizobium sp. 16-449-1b TaxID=2819989 RepID=UPI001ADBEAD8|nr:hypothetical protein [Rhizobium sp. 16-449-1b]MBO9195691.1 hypothetical protein [Rhizobium sp. 16-449-1b]